MKTIVDGIEMFGSQQRTGQAVCDDCGKTVYWDKYNGFGMEFMEVTQGWVFSELRSGGTAVCPECI